MRHAQEASPSKKGQAVHATRGALPATRLGRCAPPRKLPPMLLRHGHLLVLLHQVVCDLPVFCWREGFRALAAHLVCDKSEGDSSDALVLWLPCHLAPHP